MTDPAEDTELYRLSPGQRLVWEPWRASGVPHEDTSARTAVFRQIAADLGISVAAVTDRYTNARIKLGLQKKRPPSHAKPRKRLENRDPKKAARVLVADADPLDTRSGQQIAKGEGTSEGALARMKERLPPLDPVIKEALAEELRPVIGKRLREILNHMDETTIKGATLSQQAVAFGILTDKDRLLAGQPGMIVRHEDDRRAAPELMQKLLAELKRRGLALTIAPAAPADPLEAARDVTPAT